MTIVCCCAAAAAVAGAASLKVKVTPRTIHNRDNYLITITGKYSASELTGKAYLISVIQFNGNPCKATAQAENAQVSAGQLEFYFRTKAKPQQVGIFPKPVFTRVDGFTAKSRSTRRVCTYLYPKVVGPKDTTAPIATASARYRVLK